MGPESRVFALCRRGNDSQKAVLELRKLLPAAVPVKDVRGGLHAWADKVDKDFPVY